jgi:DNA-binding ferritin-like protein
MSNVSITKEACGDGMPDIQANKEAVILQLSRSHSTAKGNITKKIKEITEWQMTRGSLDEAHEKLAAFADVATKFYSAHLKYHSIIEDENDLVDSEEYLEKERKRIENFKSSFKDWMQRLENKGSSDQVDVQPRDSISNTGIRQRSSVATSRSKTGSSLVSAQIAVKAKRAALEAEKAELIKEQALEQQRFLLEQKRREMTLNKELAKIEAEEKVYNAAMGSEHSMIKASPFETKPSILGEEKIGVAKATGAVGVRAGSLNQMRTKQPIAQAHIRETISDASSEVAEEFLRTITNIQQQQQDQMHQMYKIQDSRDQQLQKMFTSHQQMVSSLSLPNVDVPVFSGNPVEYCHFLRSFENLIEAKTTSASSRLFYLVQHTSGEVQQLMRSCLTMSPETGYVEAKRLLKEKYGQNYSIATAYVNQIITASSIKSEDSAALQSFSLLLASTVERSRG